MPFKQVLFESEAREKVLKGATMLANVVRVTLGPQSKKWGAPLVCDDGVAIAKEMELEDPVENLGVRTIRQAAERTGDEGRPPRARERRFGGGAPPSHRGDDDGGAREEGRAATRHPTGVLAAWTG